MFETKKSTIRHNPDRKKNSGVPKWLQFRVALRENPHRVTSL